jgi:outer membrane cobalamin receptor
MILRGWIVIVLGAACPFGDLTTPAGAQSALDSSAQTSSVARLRVDIVSEAGGGVEGGSARLSPASGAEITSGGPAARIELVAPPGRYDLITAAQGYRADTVEVVLEAGRSHYRRIVLRIEPIELPALVAKASLPELVGGVGHSVSRVDFPKQPITYFGLGDWLADQPGVTVRGSSTAGRQVVSVRGSRPSGVLVLLDGMPINDPVSGTADLSSIPVSTLETATLVRGAGSARLGPGGTGGVLMLSSRTPTGRGAVVGLEVRSFGGRAIDAYVSQAGRLGQAALTVRLDRSRNDFGFVDPFVPEAPVERRRNADRRNLSMALTGGSPIGPGVAASVRFDDSERGIPGRAGTTLLDGARWEDRAFQASVATGTAGDRGARVMFRRQRLGYIPDDERSASITRTTEWRLGAETAHLSTGVRASGRFQYEAVRGDGIEGDPSRWNVGGSLSRAFVWDAFRLDPVIGVDVSSEGGAVSPDVALRYAPGSWAEAWARVGQGFRLPTFGDMYFGSGFGIRPNAELSPERVVLDAEIGTRLRSGRAGAVGTLQVGAYYRRTRDPIVWIASSTALWSPRNLDRLTARGIELDASMTWPGPGVSVRLSGSVDDSRLGFGANRNPQPYQPSVQGRLAVEQGLGPAALRVELRGVGSRTTSVAATRRLPAFAEVNIAAAGRLAGLGLPLQVQLRIDNVLDARYELIELYPEAGRSLSLRLQTNIGSGD